MIAHFAELRAHLYDLSFLRVSLQTDDGISVLNLWMICLQAKLSYVTAF